MGLKTGDIYQGGKSWFTDSAISKQILGNPINTAILITLVILLIVAYYYRDYDEDSKYMNLAKVGIYGGLFTLVALFLHNTVVMRIHQKKDGKDDARIIFGAHAHELDKRQDIKPKITTLNDLPDLTGSSDDSDTSAKSGKSDSGTDLFADNGAPTINDLI